MGVSLIPPIPFIKFNADNFWIAKNEVSKKVLLGSQFFEITLDA